jgi:RHS repeat-associated protein
VRNSQTTDSFYIDGLYERVTLPSGVIEHKFYVGNAVITKRSNNAHDELYLHKDNQGSTISISNSAGTVLQQFIYDPWGRQYSVSTNSLFTTYSNPGTSKGYTGHNMVNDFEVIHMGGRTYNPHLGRFMQADPFVQAPGNLQNYNRYSYVLNNPMSYTDPSGYFFKKLMKATGVTATMKFLASNALLNGIVMVGLNFILGCQGWCSALFSAVQSYAVTGSLGGALRAGAFAYAGDMVGGLGNLGGVTGALASGIAGGVLSTLQGGKFGHGFISAGLGASLGGLGGRVGNPYGRVAVSAVIGGTISKVAGGKFVNGAASAAFAASLRGIQDGAFSQHKNSARSDRSHLKAQIDAEIARADEALSGKSWASEDDAAVAFANATVNFSSEYNVEVGATFFNNEGVVTMSGIYTDYNSGSVKPQFLSRLDATAIIHTHGRPAAMDLRFSSQDIDVYLKQSERLERPITGYLALPSSYGVHKFDTGGYLATREEYRRIHLSCSNITNPERGC